jgi:pimeloyl-ACP methyl ester carboxylesterase
VLGRSIAKPKETSAFPRYARISPEQIIVYFSGSAITSGRFHGEDFIVLRINANRMKPVRRWGSGPYPVAVVHGGPGAPGEMAPVARELSALCGVLEPFQTESTLDGQVRELASAIAEQAKTPVTLIGFSWGAFLSYIVAARFPALVGKLILIGCGPFEEEYAQAILTTRLNRLPSTFRTEARNIMDTLTAAPNAEVKNSTEMPVENGTDAPARKSSLPEKKTGPSGRGENEGDAKKTDTSPSKGRVTFEEQQNALLVRFGELMTIADTYDPLPQQNEILPVQAEVFRSVWEEAAELRRSSNLLRMASSIKCPVVAIHGDYDPHPAAGVHDPLVTSLGDFRFIILEKCGHRPWIERHAADAFYKILAEEI